MLALYAFVFGNGTVHHCVHNVLIEGVSIGPGCGYFTGLQEPDGVYVTQSNDLCVAEFGSPPSIVCDEVAQGLYVGDHLKGRIQFFPSNVPAGITLAGGAYRCGRRKFGSGFLVVNSPTNN